MTDKPEAIAYLRMFEVRRPDGTLVVQQLRASTDWVRIGELLHPELGERIMGAAEIWLRDGADADWQHIADQHEDGHLTWSGAELAGDV